MSDEFNIVEAYHSLQGEGSYVGRPSIFIRIAGCNQNCAWCDTPREANSEISETTISELLHKYPYSDIVITGGEPTSDIETLNAVLNIINKTRHPGQITIETNGTNCVDAGEMESRILWSISPKLHSSGENYRSVDFKNYLLKQNKQFKFVISNSDPQDVDDLTAILLFMPEHIPIIVQPAAINGITHEMYAAQCEGLFNMINELKLKHYVKIIPQVHKFIWGLEAQGV